MEILKNKKILITGADGFIGSHLSRKLLRIGGDICALCMPLKKDMISRIDDIKKEMRIYYADLRDYSTLVKIIKAVKPKVAFHLGAVVNLDRSFEIANQCVETNIRGTLNLLQALQVTELESFVFSSTCEVYGYNPVPFREDQRPDPPSPYAISKVAGEYFCKMFNRIYGYPTVIIRLSSVYGPAQNVKRLVPTTILACLKNEKVRITAGAQKRDFVYVDDIVSGLIKAATTEKAKGEIINLGGKKVYTILYVVENIFRLMHKSLEMADNPLPYRSGEIMDWYCDSTKAKEIMQWEPACELTEGLEKTICWYTENYKKGLL